MGDVADGPGTVSTIRHQSWRYVNAIHFSPPLAGEVRPKAGMGALSACSALKAPDA